MNKFIGASVIALMLASGCSSIKGQLGGVVGNDLGKTIELAEKYGKPEVAACAGFLKAAIDGDVALLKEDTSGLISLAFKLYLLQESKPEAEAEFKAKCGQVAAGLLIQAGKSIRN